MELLDDNIDFGSEQTEEYKKEASKLRHSYSLNERAVTNARIVLAIICLFSLISLFLILHTGPLVVGIMAIFTLIFGLCAAFPPHYAKTTLPIALVLYLLDLLATLLNPSILIIFGLIIKGIMIYFMVKGIIAVFKITEISKKIEMLNITPYKN